MAKNKKVAPEKKSVHVEFKPVQTESGWTIQKEGTDRYVLRNNGSFLVSDLNPEALLSTAEEKGVSRENWKNI